MSLIGSAVVSYFWQLSAVAAPALQWLFFLEALKARMHSIRSLLSVELVNTAATPDCRIFWPSSGVITDPPITTGTSDPRVLSCWTNSGTKRRYSQEWQLMPMTSAPSLMAFSATEVGRVEFAIVNNLHLCFAQHASNGDRAVLMLVNSHDRKRDKFTRHVAVASSIRQRMIEQIGRHSERRTHHGNNLSNGSRRIERGDNRRG